MVFLKAIHMSIYQQKLPEGCTVEALQAFLAQMVEVILKIKEWHPQLEPMRGTIFHTILHKIHNNSLI